MTLYGEIKRQIGNIFQTISFHHDVQHVDGIAHAKGSNCRLQFVQSEVVYTINISSPQGNRG